MNEYWQIFLESLNRSIERLDVKYFKIDRSHAEATYRERACCYELYHQLRCNLPSDFPYTLHGDVDKKGHQYYIDLVGATIPDLILHNPGTDNNLAVIEVKSCKCSEDAAGKDIAKLEKYIINAGYKHGIFLRFGEQLAANIETDNDNILLLHHKLSNNAPLILNRRVSHLGN